MGVPELELLTSGEARAGSGALLVVPLGATEQHGPHLPLATDTLIATAWAQGVAAALDGAIVAPALPYGSSGEHQHFDGTISIGGPALTTLVIELVRSSSRSFPCTALLSGHAGNDRPLRAAAATLCDEGRPTRVYFPAWPDRGPGSIDAHAGRTETSLMLHLHPRLVTMDRAEAGTTLPVGDLMPAMRAGGIAAVASNGVLGDPTGATAAEGRELFDELVERTVADLTGWRGGSVR